MQTDFHPTDTLVPWTRRDACAAVALAILAVGTYANSLPNDFVYDDNGIVVNDTRSHSLSRIGELFSGGYWMVTTRPLYRPITLLSFALNHAITGLSSPGYRMVNLLLHALTCVAVYRLTILLFGRFWPALVAGAAYAVNPVHVESVVPIVGRSELLSGLGVTTALALYIADAYRGGHGTTWRYVAVVILTWASILCKESAIVLIGMVVVFDAWRYSRLPADQRQKSWFRYMADRLANRYAGMLAAILVVFFMRYSAIGMVLGEGITFPRIDNSLAGEPWSARILMGMVLLGKYVHLLLIGHPLSPDYSYNAIPVPHSLDGRVVLGIVCTILALAAIVASLRRRGEAALPIVWFAVAYAPIANILVLIGTTFAERLMYLPSVPAAMLLGLAVSGSAGWLWRREPRSLRAPAVALVVTVVAGLSAHGVLTVLRNRVWRNNETVFRDCLAKQPGSARAQFNTGAWLATHGDQEEGIKHLHRAIEISGQYYMARNKLASTYMSRREWRNVVDVLEPLTSSNYSLSKHMISPLLKQARALLQLAEMGKAWECLERIRRIEPKHVEAMRCQAEILTQRDAGELYQPREGWRLIQETVNLDPENIACLASGCRIALRQRRVVEARAYLKRADKAAVEQIETAKIQAHTMSRTEKRSLRVMVTSLEGMRKELHQLTQKRRKRALAPTTRPDRHPPQ